MVRHNSNQRLVNVKKASCTSISTQQSSVKLSSVTHSELHAWVARLTMTQAPASVRKIHRVLSLMLEMAAVRVEGCVTLTSLAGVGGNGWLAPARDLSVESDSQAEYLPDHRDRIVRKGR